MRAQRSGFTLVELLVVVAIIGLLTALLVPTILSARESARGSQCANNMRQIGLAIQGFANVNRGKFPNVAGHGINVEKAWIYQLAPYLEKMDEVRICPVDPIADERRRKKGTSYVMSSYVTLEGDGWRGSVTNLMRIRGASRTIVMYEGTANVHKGHTHSHDWFGAYNIRRNGPEERAVWKSVKSEVDVNRHHGNSANYLYADGHVENIPSEELYRLTIDPDPYKPTNFALPHEF